MHHINRSTRILHLRATLVLFAAVTISAAAMAATPKLQSIAVTPNAPSISVGQKQAFNATGTFSDGSKHALGPNITNIATGFDDTCAVVGGGDVECWGYNAYGELGDGNTADSLIPRQVVGITTATAVSLSGSGFIQGHGCALLASGAIQCWGFNAQGQLGHGTTTWSESTPVTVSAISTATAVATGGYDSCALLASGAVKCWGYNFDGELGDGSNTDSSVPVSVVGISTATAVAVGAFHSCALLASGTVKCWGANLSNNGTYSNTPVAVIGISHATAIAAGAADCALLASGAVKCWGDNNRGELGNGSNVVFSSVPVSVTGISSATAIADGGDYICAVLRSGSVKCWGDNGNGQLGNGTFTDSNIPVLVQETNRPVRLAAGGGDTCALFSGGLMTCWGVDLYGQLGNRRKDYNAHPVPINVVGTPGVVWQSSDSTKATITDHGVATGRAAGNTTITATTAGLINDNALLTVK